MLSSVVQSVCRWGATMDQLALVTWESTALASFMLVVLGCAVLILGDQVCATEERKVRYQKNVDCLRER